MIAQRVYPSSSTPGVDYRATVHDDGKVTCDCRGWINRRGTSSRNCTHTKKLAKELGRTLVDRGEFAYLDVFDTTPPAIAADQAAVPLPPAPMLATATTRTTAADFDRTYGGDDWVMEEKLDGHRCLVVVKDGTVSAWSRPRTGSTANPRTLPALMVAQLKNFPDGVFDGELVAAGGKSWDVKAGGSRLVFVAFDVLAVAGRSTVTRSYRERRTVLLDILRSALDEGQTWVTTVESTAVTHAAVQAVMQRGGEGVILKRVESCYRPGMRSPDWLKVKARQSATLTLTGFAPGKSGMFSSMQLVDDDGGTATVKVSGNKLLADVATAPQSFIGRRVVIAFQERTKSGAYFQPTFDHFAGGK
jgi:ATP-dependent DNA ligase